jgi:hypothetical protein
MKNTVLLDVGHIVFLCSVLGLLVTADVVPSSPIPVTLMMEALRSSKTSVLRRATRSNTQDDGIFNTLIQYFNALTKPRVP